MTGGSGDEHESHRTDQGPYFFLSYAHRPRTDPDDPGDPNELVHKLFRDLSDVVMDLTDLPASRMPGFMDRDLRPGDEWPRKITDALSTCRVFLALYSPRYFSSENCGKEWFAFHRRQVEHEADGGRRSEAIIPVLWVPVPERDLPEVAKSLQFDHHRLGEVYARDGFSQLVRVNRYADDYHLALRELATQIVRVATQNPPGPATAAAADYNTLECAFGTDERRRVNSRRLRVTVVTTDFYHLPKQPEVRNRDYYSPSSPTEWNPYRPESKIPLAEYTANLARGMGLVPEVSWFDEGRPDPDDGPDHPSVLLVDPWAALDRDREKRLREYYSGPRPWAQPMVPWSQSDAQTGTHGALLRDALHRALPHPPSAFPTLQSFGNALPQIINAAMTSFLRNASPHPPAAVPDKPPVRRVRLLDTDGAPQPPPGIGRPDPQIPPARPDREPPAEPG